MSDMIFTTTSTLQGKTITQYLGVVTGHAVIGINAMRDALASVRDFTGGRVASYEKEVAKARDYASDMMAEYARQAGANAVIGIDLDFEILGKENGMIMVVACGTAVRCQDQPREAEKRYGT